MKNLVIAALMLMGMHLGAQAAPLTAELQLQALHSRVVTEQWPQAGERVHEPVTVQGLVPGQGITLAVRAKGQAAQSRLAAGTFSVEFDLSGKIQRQQNRKIKLFKYLLNEGGGETTWLGVLDCDYQIPAENRNGTLDVRCTQVQMDGREQTLGSLAIPIREMSEALAQEPSFANPEALEAWMKDYHRNPSPGRLLAAIRGMSLQASPYRPTSVGFFVQALQDFPAAAQGIVARLPYELSQTRAYGAQLLRWAGYDIRNLMPLMDAETEKSLDSTSKLPDPYEEVNDQPDRFESSISGVGRLWGVFMATGRPQALQQIVMMLLWRKDFLTFEKMRKKGKLPPSPTGELVRGVLYQNAESSLRSFVNTMPQLTDLLTAWQANPATPKEVREALAELAKKSALPPAKP